VCDDVTGGPTGGGGGGVSADFFHILHNEMYKTVQFSIQFNKLLLGFMYEQRMGEASSVSPSSHCGYL
jgi:hypothetical protein